MRKNKSESKCGKMLSMLNLQGRYMDIQGIFSAFLWKIFQVKSWQIKNPHRLLVLMCYTLYPECMSSPFLLRQLPQDPSAFI